MLTSFPIVVSENLAVKTSMLNGQVLMIFYHLVTHDCSVKCFPTVEAAETYVKSLAAQK